MSILKRLLISLFGNFFRSSLSFLAALLIARSLGPSLYGDFSFLLISFTLLISLTDMGSASAFFTFISKEKKHKSFFLYYLIFLFFQFCFSIILIIIIIPENIFLQIWNGNSRNIVLIAFIAVFFQQHIWTIGGFVAESQRYTFKYQTLSIILSLFHFLIIILFFYFSILTIYNIFLLIAFEFLLFTIILYFVLPISFSLEKSPISLILNDYKKFCLPILPYQIWSAFVVFADRWMLQNFGGSIEQGYFSAGNQLSLIILLAATSLISILWKEMAEEYKKNNIEKVKNYFFLSTNCFYLLSMSLASFLFCWSSEITILLLGKEYLPGSIVVATMFIYPCFQGLTQISGALFFASENVKAYVTIQFVFLAFGLVAAYFMLAPQSNFIPGLNMSSTGLAMKIVAFQIMSSLCQIWWCSKFILKSKTNLFSMLGATLFFFFVSYCLYHFAGLDAFQHLNIYLKFVLSFIIYILILIYFISKTFKSLGFDEQHFINLNKYLSFAKN